ncbi:MAG: RNA polymerase sigma-70 factor [Balneolaceae bacterium]
MKQPTDDQIREWAEKISLGDRNAFNELFRCFYPQLVKFACRYTRSREAACDVVQDAFITVWQKHRGIDPGRSLKAYLYQIVRNKALNYLRDYADRTVSLEPMETITLTSDEHTDEEALDGQTSGTTPELLREWISRLPERRREALELSRFDGLDHTEIAGVMEVSPNTVNNHIVAALSFLKECYEEYQQNVE